MFVGLASGGKWAHSKSGARLQDKINIKRFITYVLIENRRKNSYFSLFSLNNISGGEFLKKCRHKTKLSRDSVIKKVYSIFEFYHKVGLYSVSSP